MCSNGRAKYRWYVAVWHFEGGAELNYINIRTPHGQVTPS